MLDRLKSLPLTIFLTILIWMYAEAQFASTQDNVRLSLKVLSPSPDLVVRWLDPLDGRLHNSVNVTLTVQGTKNQIDRLYQMSLNALQPDMDLQNLAFTPEKSGLQDGVDTVTLLNGMRYFRDRGITVTLASPPRIRLKVEPVSRTTENNPTPSIPTTQH